MKYFLYTCVLLHLSFQSFSQCKAGFSFVFRDTNTVRFTDSSVKAKSWEWDFGDGIKVSGEPDPVHYFHKRGTYQVCLIIQNSSLSCNDTICKTISFSDNCQAAFSTEKTGSDQIKFINSSSDFNQWEWDFGDGSQSFLKSPVHNFPKDSSYEVCLKAFNTINGCYSKICHDLDLSCKSKFNFQIQGQKNEVLCISQAEGKNFNYQWNLNDSVYSTQKDFRFYVSYNVPLFRVCLRVNDPASDCSDQFCDSVFGSDIFKAPVVSQHSFLYQYKSYIYPNPVKGQAAFKIEGDSLINYSFELINILGQSVYLMGHLSGNNQSFDLSYLSSGVYTYKVLMGNEIISGGRILLMEQGF